MPAENHRQRWRRGSTTVMLLAPAVILTVILFMLDHRPHFMLGDSESYIMTSLDYLPPDRSWEFGLLCHYLLLAAHSLLALEVLHLVLLLSTLVLVLRALWPDGPSGPGAGVAAAASVLGICLDPLLQVYARFQLSDLSAALLFVDFVAVAAILADVPAGRNGGRRIALAAATAGCGIAAVLLRVAYLPVEAGTLLLFAASAWRAGRLRWAGRALVLLLVPAAALGATLEANHLAFGHRFEHSAFTNRLSGVFLAGVFAPALRAEDFRRAGIDVGDAEVAAMQLDQYDARVAQVWGAEPFWMRNVIARHLHASDVYDERTDRAAHRTVMAALRRDPAAVAGVYLHGLALFAEPGEWRRHIDTELGAGHRFAPGTVAFVDAHSFPGITADSPSVPSPLAAVLRDVVGAYPALLGLALLAAAVGLAGPLPAGPHPSGPRPTGPADAARRLLGAALVADILAAPLYSNFVIPRYLLAGVFVGWILVPVALLVLVRSGLRRAAKRDPGAAGHAVRPRVRS
ncbi:MAG: hypothetical protein INR65_04745 [Gluconacetobacter diazotrophicus]|nr:hypothetical protein [Gluconacetobacter diazotrophicus]